MHHQIRTVTRPAGMQVKVTVGISWEWIQARWVRGCSEPHSLCLISYGWMEVQGQGAVEALLSPTRAKAQIKKRQWCSVHLSVGSFIFLGKQVSLLKYTKAKKKPNYVNYNKLYWNLGHWEDSFNRSQPCLGCLTVTRPLPDINNLIAVQYKTLTCVSVGSKRHSRDRGRGGHPSDPWHQVWRERSPRYTREGINPAWRTAVKIKPTVKTPPNQRQGS